MTDRYFVFGVDEDGDPRMFNLTREELHMALKDPKEGGWINEENYQKNIPEGTSDPNVWSKRWAIISGHEVHLGPVEIIAEGKIE